MTSDSNYLSNSSNSEPEIFKYHCPISYCKIGPFSRHGLKRHFETHHYCCAVARAAARLVVKVKKLQEEVEH